MADRLRSSPDCGIDPWQPGILAERAKEWTSKEQQIVAFLLSVWNVRQELGGPFNLVEAMRDWEDGDRQAILAWAVNPFAF